MMYLFFDTETNGKAINFNADYTQVDNWPRITQLAYAVYSDAGNLIGTSSCLVKPDGWVVPKEQFFIDNNMSTERCEAEGLPIIEVLSQFVEVINHSDVMVAHNMAFDLKVVQAEMHRLGLKATKRPKKFCTMKETSEICKIPRKYGNKWPKLEELHKFLFQCDFDGAHDALNDVMATAKCFFELKNTGLISIA